MPMRLTLLNVQKTVVSDTPRSLERQFLTKDKINDIFVTHLCHKSQSDQVSLFVLKHYGAQSDASESRIRSISNKGSMADSLKP